MAKCRNGHDVPDGQHYCGDCGVAVMVVCPDGHENPADNGFCFDCGSPIGEAGLGTDADRLTSSATASVSPSPPTRSDPAPEPVVDEGVLPGLVNEEAVAEEVTVIPEAADSGDEDDPPRRARQALGGERSTCTSTDGPPYGLQEPTAPGTSMNGDDLIDVGRTDESDAQTDGADAEKRDHKTMKEWAKSPEHAPYVVIGAIATLLLIIGILAVIKSLGSDPGDPDFVEKANQACGEVLRGVDARREASAMDMPISPGGLEGWEEFSADQHAAWSRAVDSTDRGLAVLARLVAPGELQDTYDEFVQTAEDVGDGSEMISVFGPDYPGEGIDIHAFGVALGEQADDSDRFDRLSTELGLTCAP